MAAYKSGTETVPLGREVGGDERKDIQRESVDGNKGVLPLADGRQRCRNVLVELRDVIEGEAVGQINTRA